MEELGDGNEGLIDLGAVVEETKGPPLPNEDTVGGILPFGGISDQ